MPLPFTVVSTTSNDEDHEDDLDGETYNVNWISGKNRSFPQSMVLELEEESLVSSISITVHHDFPPSSLTVSLGIPSNQFRNSRGKSYNADYSNRQELSFRDHFSMVQSGEHPTTTLHFHQPAKFIRISVHGFIDSDHNPHRQVSILSIVVSGAGEILPVDSLKDDAMSYVELDRGVLLPLKAKSNMREEKVVRLYDSDSEDEEILFSREMLNRLRKKEANLKNPTISEVMHVDTNSEKSTSMKESSSKTSSSISPPLSERSKKKVLDEILGIDEKTIKRKKKAKEVYFGSRMAELNNLTRVLERKREEAIWEERYAEASEIEESVKELKSRDGGMKQLLIEREDALKKHDLIEAQRAKDRFDKNMSDALSIPTFRRFLNEDDLKRLKLV